MNGGPNQGFHSEEQTRGRERLLELLGVLLLVAVPNLVYSLAGYEYSLSSYTVLDFVVDALVRVGWCVLVVLLLTRRGSFDWKLPRTGREWGKEFGWGLLLILAIVGCSYIVVLLTGLLGIEDPSELSEALDTRTALAFIFFTPIIGLHEELLFRVYTQTRLTQLLSNKRALPVFIASGIFAAVHGYPFIATLTILVFGLVLGTSYQANGKIPRLVIAHTLWNIGVTVLDFIGI